MHEKGCTHYNVGVHGCILDWAVGAGGWTSAILSEGLLSQGSH